MRAYLLMPSIQDFVWAMETSKPSFVRMPSLVNCFYAFDAPPRSKDGFDAHLFRAVLMMRPLAPSILFFFPVALGAPASVLAVVFCIRISRPCRNLSMMSDL